MARWAHKVSVLQGHCDAIGRDIDEIDKSLMAGIDPENPGATEEQFRAFKDAGVDIAIVNFPSPHDPDLVSVVAEMAERVG